MEKELFIDVLKHYTKSSESEALEVFSLKENFPYSQVLHALAAKLGKDHQLGEQQKSLQSAAVYAADRSILKNVMNGDELVMGPVAKPVEWRPRGQYLNGIQHENGPVHTFGDADNGVLNFGQQPVTEVNGFGHDNIHEPPVEPIASDASEFVEEPAKQEIPQHIPDELKGTFDYGSLAQKPPVHEEESVADEIMTDLTRLNQLKHDFEVLYAATKSEQQSLASIESSSPEVVVTPEPDTESKVERLIEMDNALDNQPKDVAATPKPSLLRRKFGANEAFIDEIVNRKEIEPESNKQREQLEMIDQFIKTQPSISPGKDKTQEQGDGDLLSVKSGEFTDNIVSETLVEILVKQGKKDKAIEVLKKLIWKFPQKKAYFAAQIEDLKK